MPPTDDKPRRHKTSTQRDLAGLAAKAERERARDEDFADAATPTDGVVKSEVSYHDDVTTEIDLLAVDDGTRAGLRAERQARKNLERALVGHAKQLGDASDRLAIVEKKLVAAHSLSLDEKTIQSGLTATRRLYRSIFALAAAIIAAGVPATWAFLEARDAAAEQRGQAGVERRQGAERDAQLRRDVDRILQNLLPPLGVNP